MFRRSFMASWLSAIAAVFAARPANGEVAQSIDTTTMEDIADHHTAPDITQPDTQHVYNPASMVIDCGHIQIHTPGPSVKGTTITVNGAELKYVRRITVDLQVHAAPMVYVALIGGRDAKRAKATQSE
jgi:hypothetical protein